MRINSGDVVFDEQGRPGVVVGKDKRTGELQVERQGERYENARQRGFINGLDNNERTGYQAILNNLEHIENPHQKLQYLDQKITELSNDPKNHNLVRYLTSEKAHLMHSTGAKPRYYTVAQK